MKSPTPASAEPAPRRPIGRVYRFGAFRFDPATLELWCSQRPVPLSPLPARALALLLERHDQLVSRDQLADALWGAGVHVDAEAGLNTAMRQVRRALGDTAAGPRFVETVPRRGYRFVAPLSDRPPAERPRRRALWLGAVAIGLLVALAAVRLAGDRWRDDEAPESAVATPVPRPTVVEIVLAPAETPALGLVALSVADLLQLHVAGRPDLAVVMADDESRGPADRQLLLRAEPVDWPGHARLEASLSAPGEPASARAPLVASTLPLLDTTASLAAFAVVRDEIVAQLALHLAISLDAAGADLEPVDAQAWLLYLEASTGMAEVACDGSGRISLLERSLAIDPDFAPAWYMLAGSRLLHGNLCSGGVDDYHAAAAAARRAAELAPGWADPIQLEAGVLLHRGQAEAAMARMVDALRRFPDEPFVLLRTAEVLRYAGLLDQSARLFERVLAARPARVLQSDTVAYPYLYQERWDRFLALLPARTGPFFRYYRGWAEARLGNPAAARAALAPAFQEHAGDTFARLSEALLAILDARPGEARVTLEQLARQRRARRVGDGELTFKIGQLMVLAGDPARGLRQLELALEQGFFCAPCFETGGLAERLAGVDGYRALLDAARTRRDAFARRFLRDEHTLAPGPPPAP